MSIWRAVIRPGPTRRAVVIATLALTAVALLAWEPGPELNWRAQRTLAISAVAMGLWVSKALPLMVTSMLTIILFPLFRICSAKEAFSHFGHPAVFFILGNLILSVGVAETGLARRASLRLLQATGDSPAALVSGTFLFGLLASTVISEHAVVALELPIALELVRGPDGKDADARFARAMFLALAWGCVIGGITTFLGGARVPLAVGILEEGWQQTLSFRAYTAHALPVVIPIAATAWVLLLYASRHARVDLAQKRLLLEQEIAALGSPSRRELGMAGLLAATVVAWVLSGPEWLAVIALLATSVGFLCELISWPRAHEQVDWGLILMYGGAIVLGSMVAETGLAGWAGTVLLRLVDAGAAQWKAAALVALATLLFTEAASNTAVVAAILPVAIPIGLRLGIPAQQVTLIVTLASGLAFCLPMGTPATAVALSSAYVRPLEMIGYGSILKLSAFAALMAAYGFLWPGA